MSKPISEEEARKYYQNMRSKTPEEKRVWMARLLGRDELLTPSEYGEVLFFGQEAIKEQIEPFLARDENFPHTLILGESGIGKTQLAKWIASKRRQEFDELLCPVKPEAIPDRGIVLLDEAHRQSHPEWLFPIMESNRLTVLAATTRPEVLEPAFRNRFFLVLHLTKMSDESLMEMTKTLLPGVTEESADIYAGAAAGNPRQLERICVVAKEVGVNDPGSVLATVRISADGLTDFQIRLLEALRSANRPIGLGTLSVLMYSDEQTIREAERHLIENQLIALRTNGRALTRKGVRYLEVRDAS